MAVGPIPHSSILAHVHGWDWDDAEMFRFCIRRMDNVYLSHKPGEAPKVAVVADNLSPKERLDALFGKAGGK